MKTKIFILVICLLIPVFTVRVSAQKAIQVSAAVSVYTSIPVAPNIVVNIGLNIPLAPNPNYIWIDGHYIWNPQINTYVWVDGHWTLPPYMGALWVPGCWELTPFGYRWINAYWAPRNHQFQYGHHKGRYDYYGRPVYYNKPNNKPRQGYAFRYDHNPRRNNNQTVYVPPRKTNVRESNISSERTSAVRNSINTQNSTTNHTTTIPRGTTSEWKRSEVTMTRAENPKGQIQKDTRSMNDTRTSKKVSENKVNNSDHSERNRNSRGSR
jgi:hypothetical protein